MAGRLNGSKTTVHCTITLPAELFAEMEHAWATMAGPPDFLNRSRYVAKALERQLQTDRKARNGGKPFKRPAGWGGPRRGGQHPRG